MWVALGCCLAFFYVVKRCFYEDDTLLDLDSSPFNALFAVANRLEKLYHGSKVHVAIQIPDPDSASRQNIDLVVVDNQEAAVISVKNISGFVSVDKDGNWVCSDGKHSKPVLIPNPVAETKRLASVLEEYLEQRGVTLPEGYLSCKVICPNPEFRTIDSDSFPPDVITYDQWTKLKPQRKNSHTEWLKGAIFSGKDKAEASFSEQLNSVLSTSPTSDRLELKVGKYVLGEFLEFKGKQAEIHALRKIKRSKVSRVNVQKISMFGFASSTVKVLYTGRDYRPEGSSSRWEEVTVRSNMEVLFQPLSSAKVRKYKLSSVASLLLSA